MYKIVIIDDDKDSVSRLKSAINELCSNFEVVGEYASGLDAYQSIIAAIPDVIIVDVKSPHVEGFEFLERIKQMLPIVKLVVATKLDEFLFAKKIANFGVLGFIGKPIVKTELIDVFQKANNELQEENFLSENIGQLEEFYSKNLTTIRENCLIQLVNMVKISKDYNKMLKNNGIDLNFEYIVFCVVDFDATKTEIDTTMLEKTIAIIRQAIDEDANKQYLTETFTVSDKVCIILKANEAFNLANIESYFDILISKVFQVLSVPISVGISEISQTNHNFKRMFIEANSSLDNRQVFGGKKVYMPNKFGQGMQSLIFMNESQFNEITYLIKSNNYADSLEKLAKIKDDLMCSSNNFSYFYVVSNVLNALFKACSNMEKLADYGYGDVYKRVFLYKTIDEVFDCFVDLAGAIKAINYEASINSANRNFETIKTVMLNRFSDSSFNLSALADEVKLSRSYICDLLQSQNTSYVRFLTDIRMEKAKQLLKNSKNKVMDVTEMVGYNDPYYFSHCFKRYYGMSPREYRMTIV